MHFWEFPAGNIFWEFPAGCIPGEFPAGNILIKRKRILDTFSTQENPNRRMESLTLFYFAS